MATIKFSDVDVELFGPSDVYRFDIDNRPLRNLIANDVAMNAELEEVRDEVLQARTGLSQTYPSLDARLDDLELAAGYPQKQIAFNEFMARAEAYASKYASGFIAPVKDFYRFSDIFLNYNVGPSGKHPINGQFSAPGFGSLLVHDLALTSGTNKVLLGNGIKPRFSQGAVSYDFEAYRPLDVFVGGLHVRLFNEKVAGITGRANEVTWGLPDAPTTGYRVDLLWLEVWLQNVPRSAPTFYEYGAVGSNAATLSSADNPTLRGNVGFWGGNNGDYFQLRHRLRVTSGVNPDLNPFGMSDAAALAQGGNTSVMGAGAYSGFVSATKSTRRDPGLWVAGDGSGASKAAQGTIDGYVYAVPVALVFRRNKAQYTITNQNGTATSGGTGSWATPNSGRPDGYYHDRIEDGDVVMVAPSSVTERHNMSMILEESFDRLLRGRLGTKHGFLKYDTQYDESGFHTVHTGVGGALIPLTSMLSATDELNVNQVHDTPPVVDGDVWYGPGALNARPDDFRRIFSTQPEFQFTGFTIDVQANAGSPNNLASKAGNVISIRATGYTDGAIYASIEEAPVLWWAGSKKPVSLVGSWTWLGPESLEATLNTSDANYAASGIIVGLTKIKFPVTDGIVKANTESVSQTYQNPSAVQTPLELLRAVGTNELLSPTSVAYDATYFYVADKLACQVYKIVRATKQVTASFGTFTVAKADNTGLNGPMHVALDSSGNLYVADSGNHRVVKLDSNLAYVGQFGETNVAGTNSSHLNTPMGVAVDSSGNIYISDNVNYRVMKVSAAFAFIDQFGVTGIAAPDPTHCVAPYHLFYATDSLLYIADSIRVIVLNPNTMVPTIFLQNGASTPSSQVASIRSVYPTQIIRLREDSVGNKYVMHMDHYAANSNKPGSVITKYDSSWGFLGRYGARYDLNGAQNGGINAGTSNGLIWGVDIALDEANDSLIYMEEMDADRGSVSGGFETNAFVIKMSDLTLIKKIAAPTSGTTIRPYGPIYANRPGSGYINPPTNTTPHPIFKPAVLEFDPTNRIMYIGSAGLPWEPNLINDFYQRIEKWSAPSADPDTWTYIGKFGEGQYIYASGSYRWSNWFSTSHNNSRILNLATYGNGAYLNEQGDYLYFVDNHSVAKLNTSTMSIVARFGTPGTPGNTNSLMTLVNFGPPTSRYLVGTMDGTIINESDTNGRLYVMDVGNARLLILRKDLSFVTAYTHFTITGFPSPIVGRSNDRTKIWWSSTASSLGGTIEHDISGALRDAPAFVDPTSGTYTNIYIPFYDMLPEDYAPRITGVTVSDNIIYIADSGINQLTSVTSDTFQFLGRCGGFASNNQLDGWNRPHGIAVDGNYLLLCDYGNRRLQISHIRRAYVEQHTGRIEFLIAPQLTAKWLVQTRFSAYQGVYQRGKPWEQVTLGVETKNYGRLTGRNVVLPPQRLLVTTLGKGTVTNLTNNGIREYANCAGRIAFPINSQDERVLRPTMFSLKGDLVGNAPHFYLPIINIVPQYHGLFKSENMSMLTADAMVSFDTINNAVNGSRGGKGSYTVTESFGRAQYSYNSAKYETFACANAPGVRWILMPFLVVVDGEVLLAVRTEAIPNSISENAVGDTLSNVVDLYRPVGHPMLRDLSDTDSFVTVLP